MKKNKEGKKYTNSVWDMISFSYKTDKVLFINSIISKLSAVAEIFVNLFFVKLIINGFVQGKTQKEILMLCLYCLISNFVLMLIKRFSGEVVSAHVEISLYKRDMVLNKKTMNLDYELLENPDIHMSLAQLKRMDMFGMYGIHHIVKNFANALSSIIVFVIAIYISLDLFIKPVTVLPVANWIQNLIFIGLFIIFNGYSILKLNSFINSMQKLISGDIMFANVLGNAFLVSDDYKVEKDIRIYNHEMFKNVSVSFVKVGAEVYQSVMKLLMLTNIPKSFMEFCVLLLVYLYAGIKAYGGAIQLGEIVQYTGVIAQASMAITVLVQAFAEIMQNKDYFKIIFDYLNLKNQKYEGTLPIEKRDDNEYQFEFKNVSFKYPNTESYALENINLKFNIGEKMAIVGMNGSGKTTLIKLLCRLYEPTEGEILLNGINIKKYNYDEYLATFSVVFQDFKLFSFKLGQNVASGMEYDCEKAMISLVKCGFEKPLEKMPKQLETSLYHDYDETGVEISGGEAQKIALARALYKNAAFVILDEPTAALDPISEFEIYSKFDKIVEDKTTVYISHRLSSCRFCNEIVVFDEGKIVQKGNHESLLAEENGKYKELWVAQAQYYA